MKTGILWLMRYAIIADIHSNLAALVAVLVDIERRGDVEELWCLGDVVGYGPDPHECIDLLRKTNHICVVGNHDLAALGKLDISEFNPDAALACRWTAKNLTVEDKRYLENLPRVIEKEDFTLVHGSPREPVWEYLLSISSARENFSYFKSKFCLVGHSHVPLVFKQGRDDISYNQFLPQSVFELAKERLIINPGAVGQPRDNDPRSSYAIYDSETKRVKLYRVAYDINATQAKMVKYNLPMRLVARLSHGV